MSVELKEDTVEVDEEAIERATDVRRARGRGSICAQGEKASLVPEPFEVRQLEVNDEQVMCWSKPIGSIYRQPI